MIAFYRRCTQFILPSFVAKQIAHREVCVKMAIDRGQCGLQQKTKLPGGDEPFPASSLFLQSSTIPITKPSNKLLTLRTKKRPVIFYSKNHVYFFVLEKIQQLQMKTNVWKWHSKMNFKNWLLYVCWLITDSAWFSICLLHSQWVVIHIHQNFLTRADDTHTHITLAPTSINMWSPRFWSNFQRWPSKVISFSEVYFWLFSVKRQHNSFNNWSRSCD